MASEEPGAVQGAADQPGQDRLTNVTSDEVTQDGDPELPHNGDEA